MSTADLEDDLLTEEEYSEKTGWKIPTLRSWRTRGKGARYIKIHRKIYYRWSSHVAWVLAHERDPTNTRSPVSEPAVPATP
jgi:hypothetical protein